MLRTIHNAVSAVDHVIRVTNEIEASVFQRFRRRSRLFDQRPVQRENIGPERNPFDRADDLPKSVPRSIS